MRTILLALIAVAAVYGQSPEELYTTNCAGCHGANLEGAQYTPLRKTDWRYGGDREAMYRTVMYGINGTEMPPWSRVLAAEPDLFLFLGDAIYGDWDGEQVVPVTPDSLRREWSILASRPEFQRLRGRVPGGPEMIPRMRRSSTSSS